ncbi:low temperature requirement protein A [Streptomyces sp. NPDC055006]
MATSPARRFRLAMNAYSYAFLPMLLGVAFLAAGVKKSLGRLGEHLHTGPALALAGGVALFLAGDVAYRTAMRLSPPAFRAAPCRWCSARRRSGRTWPPWRNSSRSS